jgi:hypothetical protein
LVAACRKMLAHGIAAEMTSEIFGINIRASLEIGRLGGTQKLYPTI